MNIFKTMMIILSALTIIGAVALILVLNVTGTDKASGERSIEEIRETSLETEEITTDLIDGNFVRIRFMIVTDSKDALEELEKRDFQMKNILIKKLATMEEESFQSELASLEETIKLELNKLMNNGEVTKVYTTEKVLQ